MAVCEVGKCGRIANKFRLLSCKLIIDSQNQTKRFARRAAFRFSHKNNYARSKQRKSVEPEVGEMDETSSDFFGIEGDFGVKEIKEKAVVVPLEKFGHLLQKKPTANETPVVEEKVVVTSFGSVRLDIDNQVKFHGQHHKAFAEKLSFLQPGKYSLGKHKRNADMPERNDDLQSKAEQKPASSTSVSGCSESVDQTHKDKFAFAERKIENSDLKPYPCNDSYNNVSVGTETRIHSSQNYSIDEQGFNHLEKANTEHKLSYSKDLPQRLSTGSSISKTEFSTTVSDKTSCIDEQCFSEIEKANVEHSSSDNDMYSSKCENNSNSSSILDDNSFIDDQYFSKPQKHDEMSGISNQTNRNECLNFIEDQYFNKTEHSLHGDSKSDMTDPLTKSTEHHLGQPSSHLNVPLQSTESSSLGNTNIPIVNTQEKKIPEFGNAVYKEVNNNDFLDGIKSTELPVSSGEGIACLASISKVDEMTSEHYSLNTDQKRQHVKPNIENPQTAFDYVMKLRKEKKQNKENSSNVNGKKLSLGGEKLDSKGYAILKTQVQDFKYMNQDAIVTTLKNSILYNENDLVVLSKPHGLVCSGGNTKQNGIDIQKCLPDLAKRLFKKLPDPKLHLVHTIDKETTGILVLAKTERMADLLTDLFSRNEIKRIYWTLTKGVPDVPEGIIDIPIAEGMIDNRKRMALRPDDDSVKSLAKPFRKAERAVTHYNIISSQGSAALMEVKPETNVKHQVRIHLGFGLRCPILGDHKYSHLNKLAPQKLPDDMLRRLHVQQSKVRYIPMHLHLKTLIIPELLDGKNLFFHANLPYHFATNLSKLKFKKH